MQEIMKASEQIETDIKSMEAHVSMAIAALNDETSCDVATKLAGECADWVDKIEADLGPNRDDAKRTYENLRDKIASYKQPYISWKAKLNDAVGKWRWKIKEEIAAENKKRIEDAAKEAKAKAEREAAKLEKKGDVETAAMIRSEIPTIAPILREVPKSKNVVDKTTWVVDLSPNPSEQWRLIKQLVDGGPVNMGAILINSSYLKKLADLRHEEMKTWPGITVRPVFTSNTRRDSRAG